MAMNRGRGGGDYLSLRDAIDRLFEGSYITPQSLGGGAGFPFANVRVTDEDVILEMALPGVQPDDVGISVTGDNVTVAGETRRDDQSRRGQLYVEEIWQGRFQRSFSLPFPVDADKADASIEHGILTLTLPKAEAARPRRVQVQRRHTIQGDSQSTGESQGGGSSEQGSIIENSPPGAAQPT